jgi:hypothetical protein
VKSSIEIKLHCDGCGRQDYEYAFLHRFKEAMERLLEKGWQIVGRKVFCPECEPKALNGSWQGQIGEGGK